jgi:hypothetical protein
MEGHQPIEHVPLIMAGSLVSAVPTRHHWDQGRMVEEVLGGLRFRYKARAASATSDASMARSRCIAPNSKQ